MVTVYLHQFIQSRPLDGQVEITLSHLVAEDFQIDFIPIEQVKEFFLNGDRSFRLCGLETVGNCDLGSGIQPYNAIHHEGCYRIAEANILEPLDVCGLVVDESTGLKELPQHLQS